jgi:hypothetical protein
LPALATKQTVRLPREKKKGCAPFLDAASFTEIECGVTGAGRGRWEWRYCVLPMWEVPVGRALSHFLGPSFRPPASHTESSVRSVNVERPVLVA